MQPPDDKNPPKLAFKQSYKNIMILQLEKEIFFSIMRVDSFCSRTKTLSAYFIPINSILVVIFIFNI